MFEIWMCYLTNNETYIITPQPLRAVGYIIFTHGVQMGGHQEKFFLTVSQKP